MSALGIRSFMCIPLVTSERTLGTIMWGSSDPWRFEASDVERGQQLAHCFSLAIENARLYREARDAVAMCDDFMRVAAHELRSPLTALELTVAALERAQNTGAGPQMSVRLARVSSLARRLHTLSETMLDVMHLAAGQIVLHYGDFDLRELVASAVEAWRECAARARCTIKLDLGAGATVRCDKQRIEQVVGALLSNAIKFGPGQPVDVKVDTVNRKARISVTDHGIGIDQEDVARIFERFQRAVSTRHYGGLGLGLYLVREIVRAHDGCISVSSRPGDGSTFTLLLPM